jgi:hypothetical protein
VSHVPCAGSLSRSLRCVTAITSTPVNTVGHSGELPALITKRGYSGSSGPFPRCSRADCRTYGKICRLFLFLLRIPELAHG